MRGLQIWKFLDIEQRVAKSNKIQEKNSRE